MTRVFITIDTELSAALFKRGGAEGISRNFDCSIAGRTNDGEVGIFHQMDLMDAAGIKGVFFVDPMPALVAGPDVIARIVQPIVARGHDVQLHCHTEWLAFADPARSPVPGRTGGNIKDFNLDDQCRILDYARDVLVRAGAPEPIAFRAGNYGANDDTLRALARIGIAYDSSFSPGIRFSACDIAMTSNCLQPTDRLGVIEVPVAAISSWGSARRHVQITAISAWEMISAIEYAVAAGHDSFTLVSHSFELMCRDRVHRNHIVAHRFAALCEWLAGQTAVTTGTYRDSPPKVSDAQHGGRAIPMPHNPLRTAMRMTEQFVVNQLYGTP